MLILPFLIKNITNILIIKLLSVSLVDPRSLIWPIKVKLFPILQRATYTSICLSLSSILSSLIFLFVPTMKKFFGISTVTTIICPILLCALFGIRYFEKTYLIQMKLNSNSLFKRI